MFSNAIKDRIRLSGVYEMVDPFRQQMRLRRWERRGRPFPTPHLAKRSVIVEYARQYDLRTFVETGTNLGFMVRDVKDLFHRVISVEIDPVLFARATRKFARFPHIVLLHGDSGELLPRILAGLSEPCLFWLDAHDASPHFKPKFEPPIMHELDVVLTHSIPGHVALIDDAWRFAKLDASDYPRTEELAEFASQRGRWRLDVKDDIIRIVPR